MTDRANIPPMGPDQNEETNFCRQAITNTPRMFSMLAATTEGRAELKKHRATAKAGLRTETDWRERGFAAFMLLSIDGALKRRPKQPRKPSTAKAELRAIRSDLERIRVSAKLACTVLHFHAWERGEHGTDVIDFREAYDAAKKVGRVVDGLVRGSDA